MRWEYKILDLEDVKNYYKYPEKLEKKINKLGRAGWKIVFMLERPAHILILERSVSK